MKCYSNVVLLTVDIHAFCYTATTINDPVIGMDFFCRRNTAHARLAWSSLLFSRKLLFYFLSRLWSGLGCPRMSSWESDPGFVDLDGSAQGLTRSSLHDKFAM